MRYSSSVEENQPTWSTLTTPRSSSYSRDLGSSLMTELFEGRIFLACVRGASRSSKTRIGRNITRRGSMLATTAFCTPVAKRLRFRPILTPRELAKTLSRGQGDSLRRRFRSHLSWELCRIDYRKLQHLGGMRKGRLMIRRL